MPSVAPLAENWSASTAACRPQKSTPLPPPTLTAVEPHPLRAKHCKGSRPASRHFESGPSQPGSAAAFSPSNAGGRGAATISLQVVAPPIRQPSSSWSIPRSPSTRLMSSNALGGGPSPCVGNKSVPPATTRASPSARSGQTSPSDVGA